MERRGQFSRPLRDWAQRIKHIIRGDRIVKACNLRTCPHCLDLNPDPYLQRSDYKKNDPAENNFNIEKPDLTNLDADGLFKWLDRQHTPPSAAEYTGHWGFHAPVPAVEVIRTLNQFKETAQLGCQICRLVLAIRDFFYGTKQHYSLISLVLPQLPATPQILISRGKSFLTHDIQVYTSIGHSPPWGRIQPLPEISSDRLSAESLLFVKRCLSICQKEHNSCKRATERLPTRLLLVGRGDDDHIRLVETTDLSADTQFIALSYCWGREGNIKTTADNYASMAGGLKTSELPPAIHDAVVYTRALEVPFLWVDALCIIQGDREDWERESVLMADVYANALVTLAAECSASVHEGFIQSTDKLAELSTQPQHRFTATVAHGEGRQLTVQARALPQYDHHKTPPSTWSTRGWTLQERMLATRLVSFGHELKYTCQEDSFNESCYLERRIDSRLEGHKALRAPQSQQEAFNLWQGMVCDYSRRSLTDCRDKLPAVSGVAKIMHKHTSSAYLAGIWKDNVTRDILWYNPEPVTEETTASDIYLAPSFSWASIARPVYHDAHINDEDNDWHPVAELRDCGTELAGHDAFGQVKSGYLVLSAPIITTTISLFPKSPRNSYDPDAKPTYSISISEELGVSQEMENNVYGDFLYLDAAVKAIETKDADGKVEIAACRLYKEASVNGSLSTDLFKDNAQNPDTSSLGLASALCWLLYIGVFVGEEASTYEFIVLGKSLKQHDAFERLGLWSMPIESDTSQEFKDRFHNMVNTAQIARVIII